jgi:hypothetical protein
MDWGDKWKAVIFSDEKKFNLDGPDGFSYYFHDLRKSEVPLSRRVQGGGSVMVWGGFGWNGTWNLEFISGRMTAASYTTMLLKKIDSEQRPPRTDDWFFQQDNAPIHVARSTLGALQDRGILLIDWPAYSPDMNPIENLWGILTRRVYEGGRQFCDVTELREAIQACWRQITVTECQTLIQSMRNRLFAVLEAHGGPTKY